MNNNNNNVWHGFKGEASWAKPKLVASSNQSNRADQGNHIKANEYLDTPEVLKAKVKMMAQMVRAAKLCCAYTGAGLSRSSGIPDYATKATNSVVNNNNVPKLKSNLDALPTYAHCALTAMERAGFLHHYVQQNHDGLPQKSGFPQHKMNEIHGAWYDPSNPVVQFSGNLRGDLFKWMTTTEKKIDLCLCLGTSLSGMNADRVAETPAKKSLSDPEILGTIIINIQQTRLDDVSALRIWGKLDEVFSLLAIELNLGEIKPQFKFLKDDERIFHVPYDVTGKYDPKCDMTLDLRNNQEIYIPVKGASNAMAKGIVVGMKDSNYGFSIQLQEGDHFARRVLGVWWIHEAIEGKLPQLPLINVNAIVNKCAPHVDADMELDLTQPQHVEAPKQIKIIQGHGRVQTEGHNGHRWDLSIDKNDCAMVEKVTWHLHPTFHPASVSCTEAPFTISRLGWGTFVVRADITLKQQYGTQEYHAEHELSFNGGGENVKTTCINI